MDSFDAVTREKIKRQELEMWLDREAAMWKQRWKDDWCLKGDRNTRFFHVMVARRSSNRIIRNQDEHGQWKVEEADIEELFLKHFSLVYKNEDVMSLTEDW